MTKGLSLPQHPKYLCPEPRGTRDALNQPLPWGKGNNSHIQHFKKLKSA